MTIRLTIDEANGPWFADRLQSCHDTVPWLISISLGVVGHLQSRFARFKLSLP